MNKLITKVYKNSPVWFQNFIISGYGYLVFKKRYGRLYHEKLAEFLSRDYTSLEFEKQRQFTEFIQFLSFAQQNSKFYNRLYASIDLSKISSVVDISILPVVTKELLRANIGEVYTISEKEGMASYTGGTTGKALKVLFTKEDYQIRMAYLDAFKKRLGIDPFKVKKATFSGRSLVYKKNTKIFWRYNSIYKQRLYSTFHLSEVNMPYYLEDLNSFKPEVLNGFVSAIYELASYIKRHNISLEFQPKAIFTTSETLLPMHRGLIEEVFGCKVYDQYASAEGAPFITECASGNLHYNLDTGVIETDENDNMIVTSFTTRGTPLIRYNIGDQITFKEGTCTCGSSHPLVAGIKGRKVDYLLSSNNMKISLSHLADVIKGNPNSVVKMQFIQDELESLKVLMVVDRNTYCKDHEEKIMTELQYRFGDNMHIDLQLVDDIPKESSGKYSLIKNNLKNQ
ncbi:MAG: phenylacetate--CoA ligase family protein [Flavobacterium sp.]|nr:MAG: phenylacetate--CoA ligase family protein [Flavobacterium sp.]